MTKDDGFAMRAAGHCAKPRRGGLRDSPCFRTSGEFPGHRISSRRLRDGLQEEIQVEAPQSRSGRRPQRAQNVCTQLVGASISNYGWGNSSASINGDNNQYRGSDQRGATIFSALSGKGR